MTFTVGDTLPALAGTCTDNGAAVDLTGADSVTAVVRKPSATLITREATVTDAEAGAWTIPLAVGDLSEPGVYRVDALVDSAEGLQTYGRVSFYVRPALAGTAPAGTTLTIPQGTDWAVAWPIYNLDGTEADLTGWTVVSQVRPSVDSATVLHTWSTAAGNVTVTDGRVTLLVLPATSSGWVWRGGVYDVELTSPEAVVTQVAAGWVDVVPEVTR